MKPTTESREANNAHWLDAAIVATTTVWERRRRAREARTRAALQSLLAPSSWQNSQSAKFEPRHSHFELSMKIADDDSFLLSIIELEESSTPCSTHSTVSAQQAIIERGVGEFINGAESRCDSDVISSVSGRDHDGVSVSEMTRVGLNSIENNRRGVVDAVSSVTLMLCEEESYPTMQLEVEFCKEVVKMQREIEQRMEQQRIDKAHLDDDIAIRRIAAEDELRLVMSEVELLQKQLFDSKTQYSSNEHTRLFLESQKKLLLDKVHTLREAYNADPNAEEDRIRLKIQENRMISDRIAQEQDDERALLIRKKILLAKEVTALREKLKTLQFDRAQSDHNDACLQ